MAGRPAGLPERASAVLSYWFGDDWASFPADEPGFWAPPDVAARWFRGGPEVDEHIKANFERDVKALAAGQYESWRQQPQAAVAGIILADQFTRNLHRGSARAFELDAKALQWSAQLRASPDFAALPGPLRYFACMPLMHSEALADQQLLVELATAERDRAAARDAASPGAVAWEGVVKFAEAHRDVVARWGRFPHRNALLGRPSTPEEQAGLASGTIPHW